LKYVVHLVADVHQPLHAGFADDRGGNRFQVQSLGRGTNLHAVWDVDLVDSWPGGTTALLAALKAASRARSEPIDPAKFRGPPTLTLSSPSGLVEGRLDFLFGNTVAVFTPNQPLAAGASYHVQSPPAVDLSGNAQTTGLDYTFATTTGAAPTVVDLVTEGSVIRIPVHRIGPSGKAADRLRG